MQLDSALLLKVKQIRYCEVELFYKLYKWDTPITSRREDLVRLCRFYNLSTDYLIGLIDEPISYQK